MSKNICNHCGKGYEAYQNTQKFCSKGCRDTAYKSSHGDVRICEQCGDEYRGHRKTQKVCSNKCRRIASRVAPVIKVCKQCGDEYIPCRKTQKVCSIECRSLSMRNSEKPASKILLMKKICENENCKEEYETYNKKQKFCSVKCVDITVAPVTKVCEYCKEDYTTTYDKKTQRFCSNKCRGLAYTIPSINVKECEYCGKEFERPIERNGHLMSHSTWLKRKYCSLKCFSDQISTEQPDGKVICSCCMIPKEKSEFTTSKEHRTGVSSWCKKCYNLGAARKWASLSPEEKAKEMIARRLGVSRDDIPTDLAMAHIMHIKMRHKVSELQ